MINRQKLTADEYLFTTLEELEKNLAELKIGLNVAAGTVTSVTAGTGLTGGTITGAGTIALDVPVTVARGGTGSTTASGARTALGLAIGTDVQAYSADNAFRTDKLSVFAATTSAELRSVLSDETGTGLTVFNDSPTIITPTIASFTNATHNHQNAAGGGTLSAAAIGSGTLDNARLDTELQALAGLTSAANQLPYFTGSGAAALTDFETHSAFGSFTPTWTTSGTAPSLGNGTLTGRVARIGSKFCLGTISFVAGSTTTFGTGTWSFSLPYTAQSAPTLLPIGLVYFEDSGVAGFNGVARRDTTTTLIPATQVTSGAYSSLDVTSNAKPFTWGNGDYLRILFLYEIA